MSCQCCDLALHMGPVLGPHLLSALPGGYLPALGIPPGFCILIELTPDGSDKVQLLK